MKKNNVFLFIILFVSIGLLFVINFGSSFGFLIGENGEVISSTIVGDVIIDGSFNLENYSFFTDSDDVNAVRVVSGETTLINPSIDKGGNTDREDAFILGNNCAVWVMENSILHINRGYISSKGDYAGGACSYNGKLFLDDVKITTDNNYSAGIMVSNNGDINANNLDVITNGENSPVISNIEGKIVVSGGSYRATGNNSPFIYTYDDISISDSLLDSGNSYGMGIYNSANIVLNNNTINNGDIFLMVDKNIHNGDIDASVKLIKENIDGDIVIDDSSKLSIDISNNSRYEGIINASNRGNISIKLSNDSNIMLLGDSYVKSFIDEDSSYKNINFNGYCLYVDGKCIKDKDKVDNNKVIENNKDDNNKIDSNKIDNNGNTKKIDNSNSSASNNIIIDNKVNIQDSYKSVDEVKSYDENRVIDDEKDLIVDENYSISDKDLIIINIILGLLILVSLALIIRNKLKVAKNG